MRAEEWKCPKCGLPASPYKERAQCECPKEPPQQYMTDEEAKDFDVEGSDEYALLKFARGKRERLK